MFRYLAVLLACFCLQMQQPVMADDSEKAVANAKIIIELAKEAKFNTIWTGYVSEFFKSRVNKDIFLANMSQGRVTVGPLQSSKLIDVTYSQRDIQSGYVGDIYTVRFLNKYAANSFYDFFVLIKEPDGHYRLSGLGSAPAPAD